MSAAPGSPPTSPPAAPRTGRGRLDGVDAARGLALLGMVATHLLPEETASGATTWPFLVAAGRASALFAVLAGVGMALASGRTAPPSGADLRAARRALLARAGVVAAVGLTLGLAPGRIAVILVSYGLLFAVAALFLGLRARALAVLGGVWLVVSPVAGQLLRPLLPPGPGAVPSWLSLADPLRLLSDLAVAGYYPVLQWTGYVLVGLAVGRSHLADPRRAAGLLAGGAVLAVAAHAASAAALRAVGGLGALAATLPDSSPLEAGSLAQEAEVSFYGTTPTSTWAWLLVDARHSGTPFDLLATTGSALAVLGACLLLARTRAGGRALVPLAAAGSATLTAYSAHVLTADALLALAPPAVAWVLTAAAVVVLGLLLRRAGARGPLEELAATASRAARGDVAGRQRA